MICYKCEKLNSCNILQKLYLISNDFCINNCKEYIEESKFKYRKIAEHDNLMALIYDYFTNQIENEVSNKYSDEEIKDILTKAMLEL